ncbi:MAG: helix-turn-helix domain-containing protein [Clostridiales bacterium]|nr:helix-turn-helix domain-containing protein [Clostridiales bacterium]
MKNPVNTQRINEYIKKNGLTATDFCQKCKISILTFNQISAGKDFELIALFRIARVMEVDICDLFNSPE